MKYLSESDYVHGQPPATGVLLVNLGTPDAPERTAVRRYLKQFLWDPRVVETPRPLWWLILNGVILTTRPQRSARAYASIWGADGSPLLSISRAQHVRLAAALGPDLKVELAMRYGQPSIPNALAALRRAGARRILVLPLYPQYSATTTASVFDAVTREMRGWRWLPEMRFINQYHDDPGYIAALADSVRAYQAEHGRSQRLVMSFHGLPQAYFDAGDPYYCHCQKTARLLAESLGLAPEDYAVTFQSRLGVKAWLQPYTDEYLQGLPAQGIRHVQVICPGFSVDCLETLEEVAMENREHFLAKGGESYDYIPCLNDGEGHIAFLQGLVQRHLRGWEPAPFNGPASLARAKALGASR
ncbi:MAG: ferrochelatase [Chromatiaceae bacterium]|nr:ferrochelatase [Candidatus Thioaporhodococcus sediminis]